MRQLFIFLVLVLLVSGCSAGKQPSPQNTDLPESEGTDSIINDENTKPSIPAVYLNLTEEQQEHIKKMIQESKIYDDYNPKFGYTIGFNRNMIDLTKQAKDWPTLLITRFEDVRFNDPVDILMTYFVQRFYREDVDFTYVKDGVTKKANLEVTYYINQDNHTSAYWFEQTFDGHLYVPSSKQTNYAFHYDTLDRYLYVKSDDGKKETIEFTGDLQKKVLGYMEEKYRKFQYIDEQAMRLGKDIIEYVSPEEQPEQS